MKLLKAGLATCLFVALLLTVYIVHARYFFVDVVLYAAVLDAVLAALIAGVALCALRVFRIFGLFERVLLVAVWLLAGYAFAITGPALIDRSLSFYILEKLQQRGGGIRLDGFDTVFSEYAADHRLMEVRLTEQVQSGTVTISGGCVRLTPYGSRLADVSQFMRRNLLPRHRLLMDEYTDALTQPFGPGVEAPGYACK